MDIDGTVLQEAPYLTEALRDNCPSQLLLPLMFIGRDSLQTLDGLFPPGAVNKLTHLVMFAEIKITERRWQSTGELDNLSWKEFMDSLIDSMKPLCRLTHLRLLLDHDIESIGRPVPESVQPLAPFEDDFVHNIAHEADIYPAAIRLLDAMPTLQYLFLTTCGRHRYRGTWKYWHSSKAWCVVDADEETVTPSCPPDMEPRGPSCVEIDGEEAQAVIDEEELYLRFREENMLRHCVENTSNL